MNTYDFSPLFRSTIGFDRMMRLLEGTTRIAEVDGGYPPYNIEKIGEDHYRLTLAVAGFAEQDLEVEVRENTLTVAGGRKDGGEDAAYLYRGIAGRSFKRQFELADHVQATGANLVNGLLTIDLVREVPEAMKPKRITISASAPAKMLAKAKEVLEGKKKAA